MAAPLCRLARSVCAKRELKYSRLVVFLSSSRHVGSRNANTDRRRRVDDETDKNGILTCATVVAAGIGYGLYKWMDEPSGGLGLAESIVPAIHAAAKTSLPTHVSENRDRYNFIADVVEISAPSVVYIEIKDQKR